MEGVGNHRMSMPLSIVEVVYNIVQQTSTNPDQTPRQDLDLILKTISAQDSISIHDPLHLLFPFDEAILEAIIRSDRPWDDIHHRYFFLHEMGRVKEGEFTTIMNGDGTCPVNPLAVQKIYAGGNMESISETILIDISRTPDVIENVFVGEDFSSEEIQIYIGLFKEFCDIFSCSYEDMSDIDTHIVEHEITTYPDVKHVQKKVHPINPCKARMIKVEVEKLTKDGFIFPVQLTKFVSNLVPVNKKQGTIFVYMDFHDLNKAFPKDNFPTPFIDQIVDECAGCEVFYFMDGFSGYN
jgi:hypothetical protein